MSHKRRITALLCALFLFGLTCSAISRDGLYFVAAENIVLPLVDETMPFWHDGYLYISGDVFTGDVRGTLGISRAKIGDGILLYRGEQSLLFRRNYPYAQDSEQNTYAPGMVWHGEQGYVPAAVVARYFNLLYSTVDVEHGKLVWLRNAAFTMSDKAFAKAAAFQLNTAYQEYLASLEPEEPDPEPVPEDEAEAWEEPPLFDDPEPMTPAPESPPDNPEVSDAPSVPAPDETTVTPSVPVPTTPTPRTVTPSTSTTKPVTPSASTTKPVTPSTSTSTPVPPSTSTTKPVTPSVSTTKPVTPSPSVTSPVTPSEPSAPAQPLTPSVPDPAPVTTDSPAVPPSGTETRGGQRIYLCLRGDSNTSALLDTLDRHDLRATVFCDEAFLSEQGDLLRRITATGYRVGLYLPAGEAASVSGKLESLNLLLQRTTMEKTRLALVDGATEDTLRAVRNAGFLPLRPDLDAANLSLRTSRQATELLNLVSRQSETVSVWLGGTVNRSGLNTFLNDALELDDTFSPWTEADAF